MTLPLLNRTWHFQVNQLANATGNAFNTSRASLLAIVNALLGAGTWTDNQGSTVSSAGNWTVSGSCNASVAGMDGVNRWASTADLTWDQPSDAKSWIVLRQTGIAAHFEVVIECRQVGSSANATSWFVTMAVSPVAGFGTANGGTNGTTTTRPTATDEIVLAVGDSADPWGAPSTDVSMRWHMLKTSDGRSTRLILTRNNFVSGYWAFEKPDNVVTGWTNPSFSVLLGSSTAAPSATLLTYSAVANTAVGRGRGNATMNLFLTGEAVRPATSLIGERMAAANDLSTTYPLFPMGLYSDTASNRGRHGTMTDIWWGLAALADSTTYPNDGTKQFLQTGCIIQPWNRSVPLFV